MPVPRVASGPEHRPRPEPPGHSPLAFVGLGRMGMPMCARLVSAGFDVAATDVRGELRRNAESVGARWAESIPEACRDAEIAITMLPGASEVHHCAALVIDSLGPTACWLDMSTASPAVARHVAGLGAARGLQLVDAPVGGGPEQARDGTLLAFAGGTPTDLRRCAPILDALTARVLHVGPAGAGYTVKLLVNLLWLGQAAATAEALALAGRAGLDLPTVHQALGHSAAGGRFIAEYVGPLLDGDELPAFPLARCLEELDSVVHMGEDMGVPLKIASAVAELHRDALVHYGDVDGELLGAHFVAERGGLSLLDDQNSCARSRS